MPYIKKREPPLTRLLNTYGFHHGEPLAKVLGCSIPTALKRIKDPKLLTIGELELINKRGHVPIEEIREAIGR